MKILILGPKNSGKSYICRKILNNVLNTDQDSDIHLISSINADSKTHFYKELCVYPNFKIFNNDNHLKLSSSYQNTLIVNDDFKFNSVNTVTLLTKLKKFIICESEIYDDIDRMNFEIICTVLKQMGLETIILTDMSYVQKCTDLLYIMLSLYEFPYTLNELNEIITNIMSHASQYDYININLKEKIITLCEKV